MPNICYGHFRAGNCHVIDIDRQRVALGRAERRDLGPHIVIAIICQDRAEGTARRQMTLERAKITKNAGNVGRSEEHTSELQSLMRISSAVFCLKKKNKY